jgi:hypothetical protein
MRVAQFGRAASADVGSIPASYLRDRQDAGSTPASKVLLNSKERSMEDPIFDFYEAKSLESFARCECDYDLMEYEGKFAIAWDKWSDPPPFLLIYDDEDEARQNFAALRAEKTDYWRLSEKVKPEYQIEVRPMWEDEE